MSVYFVQAGQGGPIKIGYSAAPYRRLVKMQADSPVELSLVAVVDGGRDCEGAIHQQFAAHHLRGEWFDPAPALLEFCADHLPPEMSKKRAKKRSPVRTAHEQLIDDLVDAFGCGTQAAFSKILGCKNATSVSNWKRTGLPWKHWWGIHGIAAKRAVELPDSFHRPPRAPFLSETFGKAG